MLSPVLVTEDPALSFRLRFVPQEGFRAVFFSSGFRARTSCRYIRQLFMTRLGDQCTASVQRLMPDAFSS